MGNGLEFVLIVVCLYVVVGVIKWLWTLRGFSPNLIRSHITWLVPPWNYMWAMVGSFFLVVFLWPFFLDD